MCAMTSSTALFQKYLDNYFKLPIEIKYDIIYCQRALKSHIKVHQMVLDVYKSQANPDPIQKKRIIEELESQIFEVNAEQHFLMLRMRSIIEEFYDVLHRKGLPVVPELMNNHISTELVPLINDQSFLIHPINVRVRNTEEKLIEKYFEVKNNENDNNYFEILDSDEEEEQQRQKQQTAAAAAAAMTALQAKSMSKKSASGGMLGQMNTKPFGNEQQMSLLKPMSQRVTYRGDMLSSNEAGDGYVDATQFLEITDKSHAEPNFKGFGPTTVLNKPPKNNANEQERDDINVSKNVKISRFNLRQALRKVQSETMAAKAAANVVPTAIYAASGHVAGVTKKSPEMRTNMRQARAMPAVTAIYTNNNQKPIEVNSSSGDSTPERSLTPPQQQQSNIHHPLELVDTCTQPVEYGQEMFLRIFGLFTPEMKLQMQQRRSKRKRRNVQNNERSDFHYGRIDYGAGNPGPEDKKKRKDFLVSPQVKRMQGRRPKRRSVEKSDEATTSRSSSSSPDEKRGCNECLKGGGCLDRCDECKGYYHQSCHREIDETSPNAANSKLPIKVCPACKRLQQRILTHEKAHNQQLHNTVKELKQQMNALETRRNNLQEEGEKYKIQMNTLYNIVKAIKSDPENSSD